MSNETALSIVMAGLAAREGVKVGSELIRELLAPSARVLGEGMAAGLQSWRDIRVAKFEQITEQAVRMLSEAKHSTRPVPARMLIPIIERASLEDEPELVRVWAALLANSASIQGMVLPSFPKILEELSPSEVRMLSTLQAGSRDVKKLREAEQTVGKLMRHVGTQDELHLAVINLERLQLVRAELGHNPFARVPDNMLLQANIGLTNFGARFVLACTPPGNP